MKNRKLKILLLLSTVLLLMLGNTVLGICWHDYDFTKPSYYNSKDDWHQPVYKCIKCNEHEYKDTCEKHNDIGTTHKMVSYTVHKKTVTCGICNYEIESKNYKHAPETDYEKNEDNTKHREVTTCKQKCRL